MQIATLLHDQMYTAIVPGINIDVGGLPWLWQEVDRVSGLA